MPQVAIAKALNLAVPTSKQQSVAGGKGKGGKGGGGGGGSGAGGSGQVYHPYLAMDGWGGGTTTGTVVHTAHKQNNVITTLVHSTHNRNNLQYVQY